MRHTRISRQFQELVGTVQLIEFRSGAGTFTWSVPLKVVQVGDSCGKAYLEVEGMAPGSGMGWVSVDRLLKGGE